MSTPEQVKDDLHYVMSAVKRQRRGTMPRTIGVAWAAFTLAGLAGLDWDATAAGLFLFFGSPLLYLVSMKLGMQSALSAGVRDPEMGRRHLLHWGSIFLAMGALTIVVMTTGLPGEVFGQLIGVAVGFVYFLAGVHFRISVFLWLGPFAMAGAALVGYFDRWGWTSLGVLLAIGILAATLQRPAVQQLSDG